MLSRVAKCDRYFLLALCYAIGKSIVVRVLLNYVELRLALDMERTQFRLEEALGYYTFRHVNDVTFPFPGFSHFPRNSFEREISTQLTPAG
jgi:hypothetical protein